MTKRKTPKGPVNKPVEEMTPEELSEALLARKTRGRNALSPEQETEALTMYLGGKSVVAIAKHFGKSPGPFNSLISRKIVVRFRSIVG